MLDGKSHSSTPVHAVAWTHTMACPEPEPLSRPWRLQDVLICGWGDSTFMVALLHSMDAELPRGSQVTVLNLRPKEEVLGAPAQLPARPVKLTHGPALARTRLHVAQHMSIFSCLQPYSCRCSGCNGCPGSAHQQAVVPEDDH